MWRSYFVASTADPSSRNASRIMGVCDFLASEMRNAPFNDMPGAESEDDDDDDYSFESEDDDDDDYSFESEDEMQ
jgi:hypothetical protein